MKKILIGTNNEGKINEVRKALESLKVEILIPKNIGINIDPEENGGTFEENAKNKARFWAKKTKLPTLVDDSGLCVDYLGGNPGVNSRRFLKGNDKDRNKEIIKLMENVKLEKRTARYICSLVFIDLKKKIEIVTEGICEGRIDFKQSGNNGFGYDPLFIPDGFKESFGVLSNEIKAKCSHRAKALAKMLVFLKEWRRE